MSTLTRSASEGERFTNLPIHRLSERSSSQALRVSVGEVRS